MKVSYFAFVIFLCVALAASVWAGTTTVISDDACVFTDDNVNWNQAVEVTYPAWIAELAAMGQEDLTANYGAQFIWACPLPVSEACFGPYVFAKIFYLPPSPVYDGWIKITADNCYVLSVNGQHIGGQLQNPSPNDPNGWRSVETYILDETVLRPGWNIVSAEATNWLTHYDSAGNPYLLPAGDNNPAGVIFAAQIQHRDFVPFKVTPQALNNTSNGKTVMLHIPAAPASWHANWQALLLWGDIAPIDAKDIGGAASDGAMNVIYDRAEVEAWLTANVYNAGAWEGRYTFWVEYDGFYGEDNIKIMEPPVYTN